MGSSRSSNLQYPSDLQCFSTMRTAAFFVPLLVCAHGAADAETTGTCLLDSSEAISDALDAAMFMWAAVDRCGKASEEIKCSVGILSSVQSTTGMINVILKALHKCGDFTNADAKCTVAGMRLTKASTGVGTTAANVAQHCENATAQNFVVATTANAGIASSHSLLTNGNWPQQDPAQCIVDMKDTLKNLFKTISALMKTNNKCQQGAEHCAANVMAVTAALSGMGGYLAGAVGHCSKPEAVHGSVCSEASLLLVEDLTKVGEAGTQLHEHCGLAATRLYSEFDANKVQSKSGFSATNVILAAFVPVTAIVSFVGGRVMRSQDAGRAREYYSDSE